jgi:hypothetical protein
MVEASSHGALVLAKARLSAQVPISFNPNAWAPAPAGSASRPIVRANRETR